MRTASLTAALVIATPALACDAPPADPAVRRPVDLAICLDTSGSMDGLIESAKQKLWSIVNELALAQPAPELRVALLTFGNDGHPADEGWVHVQAPLTTDLDLVSERLFALSTNGGTELVGRVLHRAAALDWAPSTDALRIVVVAGNESADQDTVVSFREACRDLIGRDIIVNSIYCGPETDDIAPAWREVAQLADGRFASIDKDEGTVVVETPFDAQLGELTTAINATYLPYGVEGSTRAQNQVAQDANAETLGAAVVAGRCVVKASTAYVATSWDLVDACRQADFDLASVETGQLPEAMQAMTPEARVAHVEAMTEQRDALKAQVAEIETKRQAFIAEAMQRQALDDGKALDVAIRGAVRAQAVAKGFAFPD